MSLALAGSFARLPASLAPSVQRSSVQRLERESLRVPWEVVYSGRTGAELVKSLYGPPRAAVTGDAESPAESAFQQMTRVHGVISMKCERPPLQKVSVPR